MLKDWKRHAAALLVAAVAPAAMAEPLAEVRDIEEALSGNGTSAIYIRVFGGVVALPNTYVFDSSVRAGARFQRPGGRVIVGAYHELSDAFQGHMMLRTTSTEDVCGLTVVHWQDDEGRELQFVHNRNMYVLFADEDPRIWRAALHMHCQFKQAAESSPEELAQAQ